MTTQLSTEDRKKERADQEERLKRNMSLITHTIAVISGKGGVGKSTVAANLATAFAAHGFVCPQCGAEVPIFGVGGGQRIAEALQVPFLGTIPIDPEICAEADQGIPFVVGHMDSPAAVAFTAIVMRVESFLTKDVPRPAQHGRSGGKEG